MKSENFIFLISANCATLSLQNVPESARVGVFVPSLFCYAKPGL